MKNHNLAFIDIETTGLNLIKNEIIEIGCVITNPKLEMLEEFVLKIKPKRIKNADPVSLKINHYDKAQWKFAQDIKKVMQIFAEKTQDCIMVGHNVAFDSGFLEYAFAKTGVKNNMHYHKLDTISIAFAKLSENAEVKHFSLRELCKYFDIENENAHTALGDAHATYLLYKKLMEI
jgi:DNA polymerase III subunit epsilon